MSGLEVLHKIKESWPKTEVIMISGHGDMNSVIEAMRQGASDYFQKPFRLADIHQAIHRTERFISLSRQLANYNKSISLLTNRLYEAAGAPMIGESETDKKNLQANGKGGRSRKHLCTCFRRKRHRKRIGCSRHSPVIRPKDALFTL